MVKTYCMKAKKKYGQNFLIDKKVIDKIVKSIKVFKDDLIVEIGPGRGALSKELIKYNSYYLAYEVDKDMRIYLDGFLSDRVNVLYQDILNSNLKKDIENINYNNLFIIGNLPYYITTPIMEHIINSKLKLNSFTVMVQKEVAQRFMAKCGTREYGYFSLYLQYYFDIELIMYVSRSSFSPAPKIDSAVLQLKPRVGDIKDEETYFSFLKSAFAFKRKTLKNNLKEEKFNKIFPILEKYGYKQDVRAEQLSEEIFKKIYNL